MSSLKGANTGFATKYSILTLSFFILLYALPAAHIQVNLDLDCLPRTRNTHYIPED